MHTLVYEKEREREREKKSFTVGRQRDVSWSFVVLHSRFNYKVMSYYDDDYDDYNDYDDYDDECSSEDDIFYHNYSVDYANQILGGHHAVSSGLPRMRRKHRRHLPQLVRVSTLDQMPVVNRHQMLPSMHSRPKYGDDINMSSPPVFPPRLPTLEATSEELERRATGRTQLIPQVNIVFYYQNFFEVCFLFHFW